MEIEKNFNSEVLNEIIHLGLKSTDSLSDCMDKFFNIMKKYNIKQGKAVFDGEEELGVCMENPEWVACRILFFNTLESFFNMEFLFGDIPEELRK